MATINITKKEFELSIERAVESALSKQLKKLRVLTIPAISKSEQTQINKKYGSPKKEYVREFTVSI